ncbi:hypothetical protein [Stratiformator vulcanicus]|nr:hypothetical protein [Stratiformator vulcanicus]
MLENAALRIALAALLGAGACGLTNIVSIFGAPTLGPEGIPATIPYLAVLFGLWGFLFGFCGGRLIQPSYRTTTEKWLSTIKIAFQMMFFGALASFNLSALFIAQFGIPGVQSIPIPVFVMFALSIVMLGIVFVLISIPLAWELKRQLRERAARQVE